MNPAKHNTGNRSNSALVSMMMPVFNGQNFIRFSIEALLKQDYQNIELIILDNLSTDNTRLICQEYEKLDPRVRYICDETPCISHEGANRLIKYANGEFCMIACDDDLYTPDYVSKMVEVLKKNPDLGMAYSRMGSVDIHGNIMKRNPEKLWFKQKNSFLKNFILFLWIRSCVPMVFGIFRTQLYKQTLPFEVFDKTLYDADNKFMLEFLAFNKVHCVDEILFYYRFKDRTIEKEDSTDKKSRESVPGTAMGKFKYLAKHQVVFTQEIFKIINQSKFSEIQKFTLKVFTLLSFLYYILKLVPVVSKLMYLSIAIVRKSYYYLVKKNKYNSSSISK